MRQLRITIPHIKSHLTTHSHIILQKKISFVLYKEIYIFQNQY